MTEQAIAARLDSADALLDDQELRRSFDYSIVCHNELETFIEFMYVVLGLTNRHESEY